MLSKVAKSQNVFSSFLKIGQYQKDKFIRSVEKHEKLLKNYTQNIDTLEQVKIASNHCISSKG